MAAVECSPSNRYFADSDFSIFLLKYIQIRIMQRCRHKHVRHARPEFSRTLAARLPMNY